MPDQPTPPPTLDDCALLIGRLVIEAAMLRKQLNQAAPPPAPPKEQS